MTTVSDYYPRVCSINLGVISSYLRQRGVCNLLLFQTACPVLVIDQSVQVEYIWVGELCSHRYHLQ
jgi:hypothetical protein